MSDTVDGWNPIPNHRLDGAETLPIMGFLLPTSTGAGRISGTHQQYQVWFHTRVAWLMVTKKVDPDDFALFLDGLPEDARWIRKTKNTENGGLKGEV